MLDSDIYRNDLKKAFVSIPDYSELKGKSFFITGSNGLICSAVIDLLIALNLEKGLNICLYLGTRNIVRTKELFCSDEYDFVKPVVYDATEEFAFDKNVDYYIHGAGLASPNLYISNPVDTMNTTFYGLDQILKKAMKNKARVLFISSSEIYGKLNNSAPIFEHQIGEMDLLNPRSSYGMAKRAAETLCASYKQQYGSDVVIVRPGHIYGPTATRKDIRVSSDFMYKAAEGFDLFLKSKGEQLRSYCYCLDCASSVITVLLKGKSGEAYNISNPGSVVSIAEMAQSFADEAGVRLVFDCPTETEKKAFNPMMNASLDSEKIEKLGWKPAFSKQEGFKSSIAICKELISYE